MPKAITTRKRLGIAGALVALVAIGALLMPMAVGPAAAQNDDCTFTVADVTMTLDGDCTTDETILIPDGFTLDGNGNTITAVDPASGNFLGAIVKNEGTTAHIKNLRLTTDDLNNVCQGGDNRLRGILFDGASGSIRDNEVLDINKGVSGCQEGNGIEVRNAPFDGTGVDPVQASIRGNTVTDYQKTGIVANGNVDVTITGNEIQGFEPTASIAQNGIQVGFGATGSVMDNTTTNNWFSGDNWAAAGILVFEASGAMVQGNTVSQSQIGVGIEAWCWFVATASDNQVVNNQIDGSDFGVTIAANVLGGLTTCNPSANGNNVVNNAIASPGEEGDTAVFVGTGEFFCPCPAFSGSAENNKVIRNAISGFEDGVVDGGTDSKVQANVSMP